LAIKRQLGDKRGIANSLGNLGFVALSYPDDAARALFAESLALQWEMGTSTALSSASRGWRPSASETASPNTRPGCSGRRRGAR